MSFKLTFGVKVTETSPAYGIVVSHLLADGLISDTKLKYALRIQSKLESRKSLLGILKDLKCITDEQIRESLQSHAMNIPIGDLLVDMAELQIKIEDSMAVAGA